MQGNGRTRRLLGCALGGPWRAEFCRPRMLSFCRNLLIGREARRRTTRNLVLSHHVLPHDSFNRGFQPGSPTAPPQPPSRGHRVSNRQPTALGDAVCFAGWAVPRRPTPSPRKLAYRISFAPSNAGTSQSTAGKRADIDSSGLPASVWVGNLQVLRRQMLKNIIFQKQGIRTINF